MSRAISSPPKDRDVLFQHLARVGHALSNPLRLRMLSMLSHKERTVEELADLTNQSIASASAHLKQLRAANLIQTQKEGRYVHVALADAATLKFWLSFRDFSAAQLPEAREMIRNFNSEHTSLADVPLPLLVRESKQGRVILLDLRPRDEYEAGHLPGAINLPYSEFRHLQSLPASAHSDNSTIKQLSDLSASVPTGKPVYAYCRGPFCLMAREGVTLLRKLGIPVLRLLYSMPEWATSH